MRKIRTLLAILLAGIFSIGVAAAQTEPGQSKTKSTVKKGAHKTGHAAKEGGEAVKEGGKTVGHGAEKAGEGAVKGTK
ncbi:hypothetical protein [Adhaeribacter terreus]|uniref:Uncharacterized protein n=1 Tax=Adhaeribacter terreus TaxID=529703 RepID=A0ABW0E6E6_9BACT